MKTLLAAVVLMGVLIAAGTAILVATVIKRLVHPPVAATMPVRSLPPATAAMNQPPGTHIVAAVRQSDTSLALLLSGGGMPDRIVVWDEPSARIVAHISLDH